MRIGEEYRFAFADGFGEINHNDMVNKGEVVESAAYLKYRRDGELNIAGHSMTLQVGPALDDYEKIPELFKGANNGTAVNQ